VSTLTVDTWQTINFRTENLTEVLNEFLLLTQLPPMIQIKTQVLNLKMLKTQVPIAATQNVAAIDYLSVATFQI
jgi:hypothetical protein